jgi:cytoskeletal protein RodZ
VVPSRLTTCSSLLIMVISGRPIEMTQSIGEKLRLARETRGIALRDISEQTRISMRYLEAIESDDYRHLPGGIFNRSFIRAYAKFIGYDEHEAIEDYTRTLRERGEEDDEGSSKSHKSVVYTDETSHNRSPLFTLLLAIIILAALSLAVWAGLYFYQRSTGQKMHLPGTSRNLRTTQHSTMMHDAIGNLKTIAEVKHDFTV